MRIVPVGPQEHAIIAGMARVLVDAFAEHSPDSWPDLPSAVEEVASCLAPGKVVIAALDDNGDVLGWVGGQYSYGQVWELHPLAVDPEHHREGIGRALVTELEVRVKALGCLTLYLGTDDEDDQTSLSGIDLYDDPLGHAKAIQNLRGHAFEFYQRCGFTIVGVMPDANGFGKPDIYMAKRL